MRSYEVAGLELVSHAQLDVTLPVLAGHAAEVAAGRVYIPKPPGQRIGLDPRRIAGPPEVRMVGEVEELASHLDPVRPGQPEVLEDRDVPLLLARVVEQVAGCVAERTGRGWCEGSGVEPEVLVRSAAVREL